MSEEYQAMSCPNCGHDALGVLASNLSIRCKYKSISFESSGATTAKNGDSRKTYRRVFPSTPDGCGARLYLCPSCGLREARLMPGSVILCKCGMTRKRTPEDQIADSIPWNQDSAEERRERAPEMAANDGDRNPFRMPEFKGRAQMPFVGPKPKQYIPTKTSKKR